MADGTPSSSEGSRRGVAWIAIAVLACAHFALSYATNHKQFLDLARYAHGQERTPFQYRTLEAWLLGPLGGNAAVAKVAGFLPGALKDPYVAVESGIAFLALLGAVLATRRSLVALSGNATFAAWASLLVVYMAHFQYGLPYGLSYVLPYDLPSLFFFCLAFLGIVSANRPVFYVAFILGTLNRETAIFLSVPFAVWNLYDADGRRDEKGWSRILPNLVAQVAIWIAIKFLILRAYAGRTPLVEDGGLFEVHLRQNLVSIVKPYQWPLFASFFGFTLPFLFAFRERIADARLRNVLWVLLPLWTLAMLVVGVVVEIRVFGELIAPIALGVAMAAWSLLRQSRPAEA